MTGDRLALTAQVCAAADAAEAVVRAAVAAMQTRLDGAAERRSAQRALHGLAWLATYAAAIRALADYTGRLQVAGDLREADELTIAIGIEEYLAQIVGGIPMSQGETVRPHDLGLSASTVAQEVEGPLVALMSGTEQRRARLVALMVESRDATIGSPISMRHSLRSARRCAVSPNARLRPTRRLGIGTTT